MSESIEVLLARIDERVKNVMTGQSEAKDVQVTLASAVTEISNRLTAVEKQMNTNAPTIEEFITIKHKVTGAGTLGKWLWVGLGAVLGMLISFKEAIEKLFGIT